MIPTIVTRVTVAWSVPICMLSVIFVHSAIAIGWNEVPFFLGHLCSPRSQCIKQRPRSPQKRRFGGLNPVCSHAACRQITFYLMLVTALCKMITDMEVILKQKNTVQNGK